MYILHIMAVWQVLYAIYLSSILMPLKQVKQVQYLVFSTNVVTQVQQAD
jgi:hypothetical protein